MIEMILLTSLIVFVLFAIFLLAVIVITLVTHSQNKDGYREETDGTDNQPLQ